MIEIMNLRVVRNVMQKKKVQVTRRKKEGRGQEKKQKEN
jgi:hypothetical protein